MSHTTHGRANFRSRYVNRRSCGALCAKLARQICRTYQPADVGQREVGGATTMWQDVPRTMVCAIVEANGKELTPSTLGKQGIQLQKHFISAVYTLNY